MNRATKYWNTSFTSKCLQRTFSNWPRTSATYNRVSTRCCHVQTRLFRRDAVALLLFTHCSVLYPRMMRSLLSALNVIWFPWMTIQLDRRDAWLLGCRMLCLFFGGGGGGLLYRFVSEWWMVACWNGWDCSGGVNGSINLKRHVKLDG